ncbi:hypothetical protein [Streptomyces sp. NBC_00120]|uniref:hypothetical protein n=1 Tax=Streptomyces sp. NBC_00120 TaxID=2975660 RepID=UPI00224D0D6E|nr:hypothetical protein [Streptomyces sp. NBC_00120]MCX5327145.1 hypothetical protein [Streptomyces sp. NBC_00120]
METVVLVAAIILATRIGMRMIHLLNARHDARIAAHHYSDPLPRLPGRPDDTSRRAHRGHADR